jgi:hypothetical protein
MTGIPRQALLLLILLGGNAMAEGKPEAAKPATAQEVFDVILKDLGQRLKQANVAFQPEDGGLAFQANGASVVIYGNQVMRAQQGKAISWFVPEPHGKDTPLRELTNPPAEVGDELLKATHHQQLVRGNTMPTAGFYLLSFYNYAEQASKLEHSLLVNFKVGKASVMSAAETERFLGQVNQQLMSSILQLNHATQMGMLQNNQRVFEQGRYLRGEAPASYNPWAP